MQIQSSKTTYNLTNPSDVKRLKKNLYGISTKSMQTIYNQVMPYQDYQGLNEGKKAAKEICDYLILKMNKGSIKKEPQIDNTLEASPKPLQKHERNTEQLKPKIPPITSRVNNNLASGVWLSMQHLLHLTTYFEQNQHPLIHNHITALNEEVVRQEEPNTMAAPSLTLTNALNVFQTTNKPYGSFILNVSNHWVHLFIDLTVQNKYFALCTDSMGRGNYKPLLATILNNIFGNNISVHIEYLNTQQDGFSCGYWAMQMQRLVYNALATKEYRPEQLCEQLQATDGNAIINEFNQIIGLNKGQEQNYNIPLPSKKTPSLLHKEQPITEPLESLITDEQLFPRSEYYTRFAGTTVFAMTDPRYWGSYHRSEATRFVKTGGCRNIQFNSPFINKTPSAHSFYSHSGGYRSPFSTPLYSKVPKLALLAEEHHVNLRDQLLLYKKNMANVVVECFQQLQKNEQSITNKNHVSIRPIVYTENDYPCILVGFPTLNSKETPTHAAKYWEEHPKPFQNLLIATFIAFLNVEAMRAQIPIEIVLRSSFGHNLPSVCETDHTFRINVGLIPRCYAELMGKTLYALNQAISNISDKTSAQALFDVTFLRQVRAYNAHKLKEKINEKTRYKDLKETEVFKSEELSDEQFETLYKAFQDKNKLKSNAKRSIFVPIILDNQTIWSAIRQRGNCKGNSVLSECFRENKTIDWFANQVMEELLIDSPNPIEQGLAKLLQCLSFQKTTTMTYDQINKDLAGAKREFVQSSFELIYEEDIEFKKLIDLICTAFFIKRPSHSLYATLERAGAQLVSNYRGSDKVAQEADFGSDSEFSDELPEESSTKKPHFVHMKLRICNGMKAILLAQYGALSYLRTQQIKSYNQDIEHMYYEVKEALQYVTVNSLEPSKASKTRAQNIGSILQFDLNYCNSTNQQLTPTLQEKMYGSNPKIVILDYTSTTTSTIEKSLQQCFSNPVVELVISGGKWIKEQPRWS